MANQFFSLRRSQRLRSFGLGLCVFAVIALTVDSPSARSASVIASSFNSPTRATREVSPATPGVELMHAISAPSVTATPLTSPVANDSSSHARTIWMEVTAYCGCKKCCGPRACGQTASGRSTVYNGGLFVAADTTLLPFQTQLTIPGYAAGQPVEVIDRGKAIKGHHIDVFFPSHEQALAWGRRWLAVTIVE